MSQKSIELILLRQFVSYIAFPIFILDAKRNLIFCNGSAEKILGFRFSEVGEMSEKEWSIFFLPYNSQDESSPKEKSPFFIANTNHTPAFDDFYINNIEGKRKHIQLFVFPIINQLDHFLGSVVFFQEINE